MRRKDLVVYAVDVGSARLGNFAWACSTGRNELHAEPLIAAISEDLTAGKAIALGFQLPLSIPLPDPEQRDSARQGHVATWPTRSALATGLARSTWILDRLRRTNPWVEGHIDWNSFAAEKGPRLLVWEASVTGTIKTSPPEHDAMLAVDAFLRALPDMTSDSVVMPASAVQSLIGAAMLRTGWASDVNVLGKTCLIVSASALPDRSRRKRDDELTSYLVKMALSQWFRDHGKPTIAEHYARIASDPAPSPHSKPRTKKK